MGRKNEIIERVRAVAEPLAAQEGLELVDVQLGGSGRTELTLFIDKLPGAAPSIAANMPAQSDASPHTGEQTAVYAPLNLELPHIDEAVTVEGAPLQFRPHGSQVEHLEEPLEGEAHEGEAELVVETPSGLKPGVSLDDCANFSRIVSAALDVEDPVDGAYELVVSSPGLDRPLRTPAHYQKYVGKRVRVKTFAPVPDCGNRKTFVGTLLGFDEGKNAVLVDVDGTRFAVPRAAISKANLDPVFDL